MTFIPIYRKSNHIDVHLTTTDEYIQNLIDEIMDEISIIKEITNRSRSRKALEKIILNLILNEKTGGCIRIARNKNHYGHHRMYGKPWYKHKWLVEIAVDGLIELGYVEHLNGCYDKKKERGRRSRIWASDKLRSRLMRVIIPSKTKAVERAEPEQIIQLKDRDKKLVHYTGLKTIIKMRERLEQYNKYIQEQYITVNLTESVWTDNEFWLNNLLRGLLNGRYTLDKLKLNQEIYPTDTCIDKSDSIINLDKSGSSNSRCILHPSTSSSSYSSINTNTIFTTSHSTSSILYPNTITSTLLSHIQILIHLFSTQEKNSKPLIDKALMISNEQLLNYFLNWLFFINKDIRMGKGDEETKRLFRVRRSLGQLGMSELIFRLKYQSLHRVYNLESFKKGGRFYGGAHLDIQSHMRGFIRINGEPVVEWDYDALHIFMLYHLRGLDIDIEQDPYDIIVGPEDRKIKKRALLTAINAPTDRKAMGAISSYLADEKIKGIKVKSLLARAKLAHPNIADDIGSGKGRMLQNLDSRIADAILTKLMAENIPALPVHDSFIVPRQHEGRLRELMINEYEKVMKFKPGITKKKKRYIPKKWQIK